MLNGGLIALLSCTLFAAAFLLFWCEPMVGKMVLPILGGAASVWTTCVLFFQLMLLTGYLYAHALGRIKRRQDQMFLHVAIMVIAFVFLPIRFSSATVDVSIGPVSWLLYHLLISTGLPFAVIASTAPLLQNWLSMTRLSSGRDPYFLYSLSNAGSLLALAVYPVLIESRYGTSAQTGLWRIGYAVVLIMIAVVAAVMWKDPHPALYSRLRPGGLALRGAALSQRQREAEPAVSRGTKLYWLAAAFVPSALMLAVTNHISLNIGSFPFIWVLPLSVYLITFIMAFARRRFSTSAVSIATTVVLLVLFPIAAVGAPVRSDKLWILIACHVAILFFGSLLCHSSLADRRPSPKYLTEFYFVIALGGVAGGMFAAIIAPAIFTTIIEYPLLVASIMFFRTSTRVRRGLTKGDLLELGLFALFVAFSIVIVLYRARIDVSRFQLEHLSSGNNLAIVVAQSAFIGILALFHRRIAQFAIGFALLILSYAIILPRQFEEGDRVSVARNFFGVKKVLYEADINMRKLLHGDTMHGRESLDAELAGQPLSYYHRTGPVGDVMQLLDQRDEALSQRIAVVGLGVGSIAAYGGPKRHITFLDVDPQVVDIARRYFTFLQRCGDACDVAVGDGRLLLQNRPQGEFDLIVVDAFNSDSIPAHLVSREAVRLYESKLKPDGILMFHVSNRYLDVEKLAASVLMAEGLPAFARHDEDDGPPGKTGSHYLIAVRNVEDLDGMPNSEAWIRVEKPAGIQPWTDEFSNMLSIIR
jgi:spermidine synthase